MLQIAVVITCEETFVVHGDPRDVRDAHGVNVVVQLKALGQEAQRDICVRGGDEVANAPELIMR